MMGTGKEDLIYVAFDIVMVIDTHFLWWNLVVWRNDVHKQRSKSVFEPLFISGDRE